MKTKLFYAMFILVVSNTFAQLGFPTNNLIVHYGFDNTLQESLSGTPLFQFGTNSTFTVDRFNTSNNALNIGTDVFSTTLINYGSNDEADTTIAFWIKTDEASIDEKVILNRLSDVGYRIFLENGKIKVRARYEYTFYNGLKSVEGHDLISNASVNDNNWHHIVVQIYKRSDNIGTSKGVNYTTRIYIDNVLDDTLTRNRRPNTFLNRQLNVTRGHTTSGITSTINHSNHSNTQLKFTDTIDDLLVYNRLLSATEIGNIATHNSFCLAISNNILEVTNVTTSTITVKNSSIAVIDAEVSLATGGTPQSILSIQPNTTFDILSSNFSGTPNTYEIRIRKDCFSSTSSFSAPLIVKNTGVPTYVDINATGNNLGTSWTDAYTNLQDALTNANTGEEIWVAAGTYIPGTAQTDTFSLNTDDLKIYGGFDGTETNAFDRDPIINATILSGDLNNNDTGIDFTGKGRTENAYQVVTLDANNVTIDGLKIESGQATGGTNLGGGAILVTETSENAIIRNCEFNKNVGKNGGAIRTYFNVNTSMTIENCRFQNNVSRYGSGIYFLVNNNRTVSFTLNGCLFNYNVSKDFNGTDKGYTGSAAWIRANGSNSSLTTTIANCTVANNYDMGTQSNSTHGSFALSRRTDNSSIHNTTISNSIFYLNRLNTTSILPIPNINKGHVSLPNQILVYNSIDEDNFSVVSAGNKTNTSNSNPQFIGANAGNYRLGAISPAVDTGDNTKVPTGTFSDLDRNSRIHNTTVDMGCYELGAPPASLSTEDVFENNVMLLTVYPNPATDYLIIKSKKTIEKATFTDVTGLTIELEIIDYRSNLEKFPSGIYFLQVTFENGTSEIRKILKK